MQFSPNKRERHAALLRNLITKRVMRGEITPKNLKLLKIILIYSALVRSEAEENINLYDSLENLLKQMWKNLNNKNINLIYSLKGEEGYKIDYSLLKLLVLESVFAPTENQINVRVTLLKNRITFSVKNAQPTVAFKALLRKQKGVLIKERGEINFSFMLPAPCVLNDYLLKDDEDLSNPFSTLNIMLFQ